jgi:deazaflavin-dependent oxidoreductase (nitroreductase family)
MNTHLHPRWSAALGRAGGRILRSRILMRAPIKLYHARLGFVFGRRTLMLEHVGRRTGARRYVVLEVIDYAAPDVYTVVSGFGSRAQWFRNVTAQPQVRVSIGSRGPRAAVARVLTTVEADAALRSYAARHARAWNALKPALENALGATITEQGTPLPMVELRLSGRRRTT